ncbi:hypothetical protein K435DRAFT_880216 [Dendrothele bispora CBS 962.96]|uniref:Uncharacterized protein n=1 Tax=Dendrothele bispora (strain CBS 962.96) TaxID=1314807 RepID=A0A4S8KJX9_DENBC|nr:hypothetical protein K435DRAFT_880216 [Dendrothele bispora CBS 962.96]
MYIFHKITPHMGKSKTTTVMMLGSPGSRYCELLTPVPLTGGVPDSGETCITFDNTSPAIALP